MASYKKTETVLFITTSEKKERYIYICIYMQGYLQLVCQGMFWLFFSSHRCQFQIIMLSHKNFLKCCVRVVYLWYSFSLYWHCSSISLITNASYEEDRGRFGQEPNMIKFFDLRMPSPRCSCPPAPSPPQLIIHIFARLILGLVHRLIQTFLGLIQGLDDRLMYAIEKGPNYGLVDGLVLAGLCFRMKKRRQMAFSLALQFFKTFLGVFLPELSGLQLLLISPSKTSKKFGYSAIFFWACKALQGEALKLDGNNDTYVFFRWMRVVCDNATVADWESARANLGASHMLPCPLYAWPAPTGLLHGYHHLIFGARFVPRGWDPSVVPLWDFIVFVGLLGRGFRTWLLSINISILCTRKEPRDGVELRWWQQSQQLLIRVETRNSHHVEDRYKILLTSGLLMIVDTSFRW